MPRKCDRERAFWRRLQSVCEELCGPQVPSFAVCSQVCYHCSGSPRRTRALSLRMLCMERSGGDTLGSGTESAYELMRLLGPFLYPAQCTRSAISALTPDPKRRREDVYCIGNNNPKRVTGRCSCLGICSR